MITAITLENFKGIGEAVTIPIRPLTIMFGKNSAGKSTVVQALHYAREILLRDNLNADRTMRGGAAVDLGGFKNLLHNRDSTRPMRFRFELDLENTDLPTYGFDSFHFNGNYAQEISLSGDVRTAAVEIVVHWSETLEQPIITEYKTSLNGAEIARLITSLDGKNVNLSFNADHALLAEIESNRFSGWQEVPYLSSTLTDSLTNSNKSLPVWGERLEFYLDIDHDFFSETLGDLRASQSLVAPGEILSDWLNRFRYIGPLRAQPPRNFQPALTEEESDWANGLAAWRELYNDKGLAELLVSGEWLGYKLKTGYRFELNQFREIPLDSPLMFALENNTVFDDIADTAKEISDYPIKSKLVLVEEKSNLEVAPHDIGVGISQVMPVIVAALVSNDRMIALEQPELHLHPAMQAELGDLFIESALGETKNFFLIETHSEHLILRILRRIREQAEGEKEDSTSPDVTPADVQLIYIEPSKDGTILYNLPITEEGDFTDNVPGGFFAERAKELF